MTKFFLPILTLLFTLTTTTAQSTQKASAPAKTPQVTAKKNTQKPAKVAAKPVAKKPINPAPKPAVHTTPKSGAKQTNNSELLAAKDSLFLTVNDTAQKVVQHPVKAKQTLFSIAKYYSVSLEELYDFNPNLRTDPILKANSRLNIPIPNIAIKRYQNKNFDAKKHTPIYYLVQSGETLYTICKKHFDMPVDTIVKRNKLKTKDIKPGQLILVGWMSTEGVPLKFRSSKASAENKDRKTDFDKNGLKLKEVTESGICFWQKDSNEKGDLYALHNEAASGTILAVTNPMSQKTVYAKVIGIIPAGHDKNTKVILSPAAARQIGAKDPKFYVKVRYFKKK